MNWGTRIAILYLGFVALILTLAFTCFGQNVELESKDYYAKELKFQDQLDATANANQLAGAISYSVINRSVQMNLPKKILTTDFKGSVNFFRPSDSSKDKIIVLKNMETQILTDPGLIKGIYKMQVSFVSNGQPYYKEAIITLQ